MITKVTIGQNYVNVSISVTNNEGDAVDPDSAEAWFYKVSQIDGSLNLDTNIDGDGKVTLLKQDAQTGFYGNSINTSSLVAAEYVVLFKATFGTLNSISNESISISPPNPVDYASIADAIWNEILSGTEHFASGSAGEALTIIKGMIQQNFVLDSTSYNSSGLLTSARIRIFSTKTDVLAATDRGIGEGEIATFDVTTIPESTPNDGLTKMYKVQRQ